MESILLEDNPHWVNVDAYDSFVTRELLVQAKKLLEAKEVLAIIGARRVGKSTLAKLLIKTLIKKEVAPKNIFFINLEKPEFIPYKEDATYLGKIFDAYVKLAEPNLQSKVYFFIDEIQIFKNWELFLKSKYENSNIKFVITGSNSSLLTSEFSTLLTGRVLKLRLHSFSFKELLAYKKIDVSTKLDIVQNKIAIFKAYEEYIKWGGYFSVISNSDELVKKEILKNIAEDIILKDIVPRYKIKNSAVIKDLFFYVVSNVATLLNYSSLAAKLGIDAKMVKEYISYFEDNFLITLVSRHHNKLTETIKSSKKVYANDNGFLNLGINPNRNIGNALENLVFTSLMQRNKAMYYLQEKNEIDFFCENALIQVSYSIDDEKTRKRELNALAAFDEKYDKVLVTDETDATLDGVEVMSYVSFELNTPSFFNK
jgi:predicted AAA+ superfamily ATPase